MKTTELKKLMPTNKADIQGHGVVEFYTSEQVVEILRLLGVVGRSEQLIAKEQDSFDKGYTKGWTEGFNSGKVNGD